MQRLESGSEFGPYTIEGFVAAGGMGQVYAARNTVYGSPVALKVLHEHLHQDEGWRLRFNLEGVIGQQLKHPNVLSARELVEFEGRVALVMDLIKGCQTLDQVISREFPAGLPPASAMRAFLGILQGVEYGHLRAVVHGDIKPENVLVKGEFARPDTWECKVTDFGTVGLIAHPVILDGRTAVVATPRYASPEHLYGVDKLEPRSDIYSLGLILHYMLTGRHASTARTVKEAAERVTIPMPLVNLVDLPDALISVFQTATSVAKEQRYASCRHFALSLREVLDAMGEGLELEDLTADLATEVMDERVKMKKELQVGAGKAAKDDQISDSKLETEVFARNFSGVDDEEATELLDGNELAALMERVGLGARTPSQEVELEKVKLVLEQAGVVLDEAAAEEPTAEEPAAEEPAEEPAAEEPAEEPAAEEPSLADEAVTATDQPLETPVEEKAEEKQSESADVLPSDVHDEEEPTDTFGLDEVRAATAEEPAAVSEASDDEPAETDLVAAAEEPEAVAADDEDEGIPIYVWVAVAIALIVFLIVFILGFNG